MRGFDARVGCHRSTFDDRLARELKSSDAAGFRVEVNTPAAVARDPAHPEWGNWEHARVDAGTSRRTLGRHRDRLRELGLVVEFDLGPPKSPLIVQRWNPRSLSGYFADQRSKELARRRQNPTNDGLLKRGPMLPSSGSLSR